MTSSNSPNWMADYDVDGVRGLPMKISWRLVALYVAVFACTVGIIKLTQIAVETFEPVRTASLGPVLIDAPTWLAGVTLAVALVLFIGGTVLSLLPSRMRAVNRNPLWRLSAAQRKQVRQRIRAGRPETAGELPLLRAVATATDAGRFSVVSLAGVTLLMIWLAMTDPSPALPTFFVVPFLGLVGYSLVQVRRARAFLRHTTR